MKGCVFVTKNDSTYGFTLSGFEQLIANEDNVLEVVSLFAERSEPGLIFIDERLLSERILGRLHLLEKKWGGAIISLPEPGRTGEPPEKDFGKRFVARVLGYQMKLS